MLNEFLKENSRQRNLFAASVLLLLIALSLYFFDGAQKSAIYSSCHSLALCDGKQFREVTEKDPEFPQTLRFVLEHFSRSYDYSVAEISPRRIILFSSNSVPILISDSNKKDLDRASLSEQDEFQKKVLLWIPLTPRLLKMREGPLEANITELKFLLRNSKQRIEADETTPGNVVPLPRL